MVAWLSEILREFALKWVKEGRDDSKLECVWHREGTLSQYFGQQQDCNIY
jgi:hypothetical protein